MPSSKAEQLLPNMGAPAASQGQVVEVNHSEPCHFGCILNCSDSSNRHPSFILCHYSAHSNKSNNKKEKKQG